MEWEVKNKIEGRRVSLVEGNFISLPNEEPEVNYPAGFFRLRYNHFSSAWILEPVDIQNTARFFGVHPNTLALRTLTPFVKIGGQDIGYIPEDFRLTQYNGEYSIQPPAYWWTLSSGQLPKLALMEGEYPLVDVDSGEVNIVPKEEVRFLGE